MIFVQLGCSKMRYAAAVSRKLVTFAERGSVLLKPVAAHT
jgi:hypothetical protein